jgi:hypothetical protein
MKKNQHTENTEDKGSGIFFWIFIGLNVVLAITAVIRFLLG